MPPKRGRSRSFSGSSRSRDSRSDSRRRQRRPPVKARRWSGDYNRGKEQGRGRGWEAQRGPPQRGPPQRAPEPARSGPSSVYPYRPADTYRGADSRAAASWQGYGADRWSSASAASASQRGPDPYRTPPMGHWGPPRDYAEERPDYYQSWYHWAVRHGENGYEVGLRDKGLLDEHITDFLACFQCWLRRSMGDSSLMPWRLASFDLSNNGLSEESIARVCAALRQDDVRVQRLRLAGNRARAKGTQAVTEYLWDCLEPLVELDLGHSEIHAAATGNDDPVSALLRCLYNHPSYPRRIVPGSAATGVGTPARPDGPFEFQPLILHLSGNMVEDPEGLLQRVYDKGGKDKVRIRPGPEVYSPTGEEFLSVYMPLFYQQAGRNVQAAAATPAGFDEPSQASAQKEEKRSSTKSIAEAESVQPEEHGPADATEPAQEDTAPVEVAAEAPAAPEQPTRRRKKTKRPKAVPPPVVETPPEALPEEAPPKVLAPPEVEAPPEEEAAAAPEDAAPEAEEPHPVAVVSSDEEGAPAAQVEAEPEHAAVEQAAREEEAAPELSEAAAPALAAEPEPLAEAEEQEQEEPPPPPPLPAPEGGLPQIEEELGEDDDGLDDMNPEELYSALQGLVGSSAPSYVPPPAPQAAAPAPVSPPAPAAEAAPAAEPKAKVPKVSTKKASSKTAKADMAVAAPAAAAAPVAAPVAAKGQAAAPVAAPSKVKAKTKAPEAAAEAKAKAPAKAAPPPPTEPLSGTTAKAKAKPKTKAPEDTESQPQPPAKRKKAPAPQAPPVEPVKLPAPVVPAVEPGDEPVSDAELRQSQEQSLSPPSPPPRAPPKAASPPPAAAVLPSTPRAPPPAAAAPPAEAQVPARAPAAPEAAGAPAAAEGEDARKKKRRKGKDGSPDAKRQPAAPNPSLSWLASNLGEKQDLEGAITSRLAEVIGGKKDSGAEALAKGLVEALIKGKGLAMLKDLEMALGSRASSPKAVQALKEFSGWLREKVETLRR